MYSPRYLHQVSQIAVISLQWLLHAGLTEDECTTMGSPAEEEAAMGRPEDDETAWPELGTAAPDQSQEETASAPDIMHPPDHQVGDLLSPPSWGKSERRDLLLYLLLLFLKIFSSFVEGGAFSELSLVYVVRRVGDDHVLAQEAAGAAGPIDANGVAADSEAADDAELGLGLFDEEQSKDWQGPQPPKPSRTQAPQMWGSYGSSARSQQVKKGSGKILAAYFCNLRREGFSKILR